MMLLFGFEMHWFAYLLSFGFRFSAGAMAFIPVIVLGLVIVPAVGVGMWVYTMTELARDNSDEYEVPGLSQTLGTLLILMATFSPIGTLMASSIVLTFPHYLAKPQPGGFLTIENRAPIWGMALISIAKTILFAAATYYLDTKDYLPLPPADAYSATTEYLESLDSDVRDEHEAIHSTDHGEGSVESPSSMNSTVVMKDLRKVYAKPKGGGVHVAVQNTSLRVPKVKS